MQSCRIYKLTPCWTGRRHMEPSSINQITIVTTIIVWYSCTM